jgi:hypothetical protein
MSERYGRDIDLGLLWNVQKPGMSAVRSNQLELAGLMGHRNRLAAAMQAGSRAPPMLQESWACGKCPVAETCALHHKVCA